MVLRKNDSMPCFILTDTISKSVFKIAEERIRCGIIKFEDAVCGFIVIRYFEQCYSGRMIYI